MKKAVVTIVGILALAGTIRATEFHVAANGKDLHTAGLQTGNRLQRPAKPAAEPRAGFAPFEIQIEKISRDPCGSGTVPRTI